MAASASLYRTPKRTTPSRCSARAGTQPRSRIRVLHANRMSRCRQEAAQVRWRSYTDGALRRISLCFVVASICTRRVLGPTGSGSEEGNRLLTGGRASTRSLHAQQPPSSRPGRCSPLFCRDSRACHQASADSLALRRADWTVLRCWHPHIAERPKLKCSRSNSCVHSVAALGCVRRRAIRLSPGRTMLGKLPARFSVSMERCWRVGPPRLFHAPKHIRRRGS